MIYSIKLSNFKQHKSYEANFEAGLNTVQGENGMGKTTVLKAIMFSLFGVAAAGSKEHLTTWGETKMSVEIDLLLTVGRVTVIRSLTKAEVKLGDELLASGQTAVTSYVESQLGMTAKLFKNMLYAEQGETQLLLKMGAAGLQRQLETVANIEVIDRVIAQISTDNIRAEGELQGIGEVGDVNSLREAAAEVNRVWVELNSYLLSDEQKVQQSEIAFRAVKDAYDNAYANSVKHSRLQSELIAAKAQLNLLNEQQARLLETKPIQTCPQTVLGLEDRVSSLSTALAKSRDQLRWDREAIIKHTAVTQKVCQLRVYKPILEQAKLLVADMTQKHEALLDARSAAQLAGQAEHSATCLSCKRPLDGKDVDRLKREAEEAQRITEAAFSICDKAKYALGSYLDEHSLTATQGRDLEVDLEIAEREFANLTPTKTVLETLDMEANITDQAAALELLIHDLADMQAAERNYNVWVNQYNEAVKASTPTESLVTQLQEKHTGLEVLSSKKLEELNASQTSAYTLVQEQNRKLHELKHALQEQTAKRDKLNATIIEVEEKADRINKIQHEAALRSELQKYLRTNRAKFMEDSWSSLTNYASHLISSVTDGFICNLSRSDTGDFYVIEGGQSAPVEELSGARKSIVGLCLRLSLAHLFYGTGGFTLLDEVTADCSENNAARVAGMLRGLQSQVIMVTHRQSDAVNANHSIFLN